MREFRSGDLVKSTTNGTLALLCQRSRLGEPEYWEVILGRCGDTGRWHEDYFELTQRRPYLGEWVSQNGELGLVVEVEDPCVTFTVAWYSETLGVDNRFKTRYTTPTSMAKLTLHGLDVNFPHPGTFVVPEPHPAEEVCKLTIPQLRDKVAGRVITPQDIFQAEHRLR